MTAEEIRKELEKNAIELFPACQGSSERMLRLLSYSAQMETAAQLAELNEQVSYLVPRPIIRKTNG